MTGRITACTGIFFKQTYISAGINTAFTASRTMKASSRVCIPNLGWQVISTWPGSSSTCRLATLIPDLCSAWSNWQKNGSWFVNTVIASGPGAASWIRANIFRGHNLRVSQSCVFIWASVLVPGVQFGTHDFRAHWQTNKQTQLPHNSPHGTETYQSFLVTGTCNSPLALEAQLLKCHLSPCQEAINTQVLVLSCLVEVGWRVVISFQWRSVSHPSCTLKIARHKLIFIVVNNSRSAIYGPSCIVRRGWENRQLLQANANSLYFVCVWSFPFGVAFVSNFDLQKLPNRKPL